MSRMILRSSFVFFVSSAVVLFATSSFLPSALNADVPEETCEGEADAVSTATNVVIQQQAVLHLSLADEAAAAAALSHCEMSTPGQCGTEQDEWDLTLQLVALATVAAADAIADYQDALAAYNDCIANGSSGREEGGARVAQAVEFKAPVFN